MGRLIVLAACVLLSACEKPVERSPSGAKAGADYSKVMDRMADRPEKPRVEASAQPQDTASQIADLDARLEEAQDRIDALELRLTALEGELQK